MTDGFLRNLKYQGRTVAQMLLYTLATMILLLLWQALTTPLASLAQDMSTMSLGYLLFASAIWSSGTFLSMHTVMLPLALSMSTTRRASFWSCQAAKVIYSAGVGVIGLLCAGAVRAIRISNGPVGITAAVLAVFMTLFFASLTELAGLVSRRFGRWGTIIYIAICAVFGMGVGIAFAMAGDGELSVWLYRALAGLSGTGALAMLCAALTAVSALATAVSGLLYRKASV